MTSRDDVRAVVAGGADATGVLVLTRHRAEDAVELSVGRDILTNVPPYIGRYAITHATEFDELQTIIETLPIDTLQLHDDVSPDVAKRIRETWPWLRVIKAIPIASHEVPNTAEWQGLADALICDSVNLAEDRIGGTGQTHDWSVSAELARESRTPVILAGGLRPENVGEAVRVVRPWAVNVNSGVEADGVKSEQLVAEFVRQANVAVVPPGAA